MERDQDDRVECDEDDAYKMHLAHLNHFGYPRIREVESSFPVEAFMMVTQLHWEDDIIWGTEPENERRQKIHKSRAISPSQDNFTSVVDVHWEDKIIWDADDLFELPDLGDVQDIPAKPSNEASESAPSESWIDKFRSSSGSPQQNPFNISNDEYYQPCVLKEKQDNLDIRHAIPAQMIDPLLFPTNLSYKALDRFHRRECKRLRSGKLSSAGPHGVLNLYKVIQHHAKQWEKELKESGSGGVYWAKSIDDLSGRNGTLVLMEYSEEHPPLLGQVGMNSLIRNYMKRIRGQDRSTEIPFGELVPSSQALPFLGALKPGQCLQSLENNMYRAPVYQHQPASTDFLLIRTPQNYFIREIDGLFTVGQQCPLIEVPAPNRRDLRDLQKNLLKHWVFRKLIHCRTQPPKIRVNEVLKAFPSVPSSSLKKLLPFAHVVKNEIVFKPECVLPTEEELATIANPEQWCAFWSSKAAEQRLKNAGYLEKHLVGVEDEEANEKEIVKDEIKAAPWNTTKTFLEAIKGKCTLQAYGPADPTGCGEAFSYSRAPRGQQSEEIKANVKKAPIQGSQWDLRRLNKAKAIRVLKSMGVDETHFKGLGRPDLMRLLRSISKDKALKGEFNRFARISGVAMTKELYKEEYQRIFERQNQSLASDEILSSDDESSGSEYDSDADIDEMGKDVEALLEGDKTRDELMFEKEELERNALKEAMLKDSGDSGEARAQQTSGIAAVKKPKRILKIDRTYVDDEGQEFTRTEIVSDPAKIDLYVKYRTTEVSDKEDDGWTPRKKKTPSRPSQRRTSDDSWNATNCKAKCGACGTVGHFRTNKACPMYGQMKSTPKARTGSSSDQTTALTKVEGIKLTFSKTKEPKEKAKLRSKNATDGVDFTPPKKVDRRRTDPKVCMSNIFEAIWNDMSKLPDIDAFRLPVTGRRNQVGPSYFAVVKKPMDLQTIRHKIREKKYELKVEFEEDVKLLLSNSDAFNGPNHPLTVAAAEIVRLCMTRLHENEAELVELEIQINPLRGPDNLKSLNYILRKILEKLKTMKISAMFLKPVNKKAFPDYYKIIQTPIDLSAIGRKVDVNLYRHRDEFFEDLKLLSKNAETYNGPDSNVTAHSKLILEHALENIQEYKEILAKLEKNLQEETGNSDSEDDQDMSNSTESSSEDSDDSDADTNTSNASACFTTEHALGDEPLAKKLKLELKSDTPEAVDAHKSADEDDISQLFDLQTEDIHNLADNLDLSAFNSGSDCEIDDALTF